MAAKAPPKSDLPRSFFVIPQDPRREMRETVEAVLSDGLMGVLSILLLPIILLPLVVTLPASVLGFFEAGDIVIVIFFVVEYLAKLYLAEDRKAHFLDPWHLLDLAVVLVSFASYASFLGLDLHGSWPLLLRLIRLPRALAVGARYTGRRSHRDAPPDEAEPGKVQESIQSLGPDITKPPTPLTWEQIIPHVLEPTQEWIDLAGISRDGTRRLSQLLSIPEPHFRSEDVDDAPPHIHNLERVSFLFLHSGSVTFPRREEEFFSIDRSGLVVICAGPTILTVSPHRLDLQARIQPWIKQAPPANRYCVNVLYGILAASLEEYRSIFDTIEEDLAKIGRLHRSMLPKDFLERMYAMRREVGRLVSTLVHFKEMLALIDTRQLPLDGFDDRARENFRLLQGDAEYLSEIASDVTESIQMDVDLYINQEAFETNRMLKVLAVITGLSLVPAVLGGILGMNLLGQPYPLELWQVIAAMACTVAFLMYSFIKIGWLKT